MSPVAGVDGGGSGTRALVLSEAGEEIGIGEGPTGLVDSADVPSVADAVEAALAAATREAGVPLPLTHLVCGLAGAGTSDVQDAVRTALADRTLADRVTVTTDVDVAFHDAFPEDGPGILLVAGTGSVAMGSGADGRRIRSGGWGALLDDAGSGYRIGLAALSSVLRAYDGRAPATGLSDPVLEAMEVPDPPGLVQAAERASKRRIAALAPRIVEWADAGDPVADRIVGDAVAELVRLVEAVARRLPADGLRPPVALSGGLIDPGGPLRERIARALPAAGFTLADRPVRGVRGAAKLALSVSLDIR